MARRKKHSSLLYPGWEVEERLPGSGRPPEADSGVSHLRRLPVSGRYPILVTFRILEELPSLRSAACHRILRDAFEARRNGESTLSGSFRLVHYSVVDDHIIHLIVEAKDRDTLTREMKGLSIRIARGINRLVGRKGTVMADRYDDRILRSQEEVDQVLGGNLKLGSGRRRYSSESSSADEHPTSKPRTNLLKKARPKKRRSKRRS